MLNKAQENSEDKTGVRELVFKLHSLGVPTQDIADILGKTRNSIDIHLTELRKTGKIKNAKKKKGREDENLQITEEATVGEIPPEAPAEEVPAETVVDEIEKNKEKQMEDINNG